MDKKTRLKDIVKCCEVVFDRGDSSTWKHSDFSDLNRQIFNKTGVNISANTLKRIFGKISVDNDYLPQQATIEALKEYCDYVPQLEEKVEQEELTSQEPTEVEPEFKKNILKKYWFFFLVILAVILVAVLLTILKQSPQAEGVIRQVSTEGLLPTTVFFEFDFANVNDSVYIDFGDKSPKIYLSEADSLYSHNYLFPGVFVAKLRTRNSIIATTPVFVASNKWIGLAYHRQVELPERYYQFPALKVGMDSLFHIENRQLFKLGLDTSRSIFTRLCNYTSTGYEKDNFVFEATFRNELIEKGIYCNSTQFHIAGLNKSIRFKFVSPGCSYRVINLLSEKVFEGNKVNLSNFVINLETWNHVKLINKNKSVQLFVNNKLLFQDSYTVPLGEIKGVFLEFEGNGFIENCKLTSDDSTPLFQF